MNTPSATSALGILLVDLTRDYERAQPHDAMQFCANWFQRRLEEQRTRARDALGGGNNGMRGSSSSSRRGSVMNYVDDSPIDPLERKQRGSIQRPPSIGFTNPFSTSPTPLSSIGNDFLHPPNSAIFARRTSVSAESIPIEDLLQGVQLPTHPKTDAQLARIKLSIRDNFIFRDLDEEQETGVLDAMREVSVAQGEEVIRQGDVGEFFYVVESGVLDCYILGTPTTPTTPTITTTVASCPPGTSFGELALMYGHPRAATVLSRTPALLWALDRITFRTIILAAAHRRRTMYEGFLRDVVLLQGLSHSERSKIADALVSRVYEDGEQVVRQGEVGDTFFFVEEGEAVVRKRVGNGDEVVVVGKLVKGDYFGELSLLRLAPRAATVEAVVRPTVDAKKIGPKLKVAALDAPAFTRLLGPLREIMERRAGESYLM
ncbi:cyclic nucleotide-binding-like protein [Lentinula edodes]|uniref:cyclic nucleotide-binding-like protein n=1 Tax=Lentinula edodes TaxID=5353 RepID=UPI001E8D69DD|nr:cyclic nucleotide-binding-like protein [Lentinula edodes]KAH7879601.1 cyclic nucleotide-binding-like protein [Lentinula edodes]